MAGIHADHGLTGREGVVGVKLVRSGGVALKTEAEHLALDRIAVILPVDRLGKNAVERFDEPLARAERVDAGVLRAIRDPVVRDAHLAELAAEILADLPAGDAVLYPEIAHFLLGTCERPVIAQHRVGEVCGVKIKTDALFAGIVHPPGEMLGADLVARHLHAVRERVHRVQRQMLRARDEREHFVERDEVFLHASRLAGGVARGGDQNPQSR